ncbi:hypothetical protein ABZ725_01250 [Streptomyces sp. NPDC006872]|uniref:hypothetical protein n=1 Tax=Streptomyces sp. NPDC006872 TaxID=3155720 RepID=UPI0033CD7584
MYKRRRVLGTFLGVTLGTVLLPGISTVGDDPPWAVFTCGALFLIVNQLIHSYPSAIRTSPRGLILALAGVGVVQDTLLWLLASWLGSQLTYGIHVDGFLAALLGGLIARVTVLGCMAVGPQPAVAEHA